MHRRSNRARKFYERKSICHSLILSDSEKLKQFEQKRCQKVLKQLEKAKEKLAYFSEKIQPAYTQWINVTLGRELTEWQELAQKQSDLSSLVSEVRMHAKRCRVSLQAAYQIILERRNHPEDQNEYNDSDFSQSEQAEEEDLRKSFELLFGRKKNWIGPEHAYEEFFREFKEKFNSEFSQQNKPDKANPFLSQEKTPDIRLKDRYRDLARKLHPDLNPDLDPKKKDLWFQVQEAYDLHDLERLETLTALSNVLEDNLTKIEGITSLRNLYLELKSGLRQIEKKIRLAKKDPSWNFETVQASFDQLEKLRSKTLRELKMGTEIFQNQIAYLEKMIESWKKQAAPKKHRNMTKEEMDAYTGFG